MKKGLEIKGAASFISSSEPMETEDRICTKENIMDSSWLFSNVPWGNHDNKNCKLLLGEITTLHIGEKRGEDGITWTHKTIEFDNIIVDCIHGFFGNSYSFEFRLGDEKVHHTNEQLTFAFTKEEVIERLTLLKESEIKFLNYQINLQKKDLENIKLL